MLILTSWCHSHLQEGPAEVTQSMHSQRDRFLCHFGVVGRGGGELNGPTALPEGRTGKLLLSTSYFGSPGRLIIRRGSMLLFLRLVLILTRLHQVGRLLLDCE